MRISRLGAAVAAFTLSLGLLTAAEASSASTPEPKPRGQALDLRSLDAVSATDIWTVGGYTPPGGGGESSVPITKHYDGVRWRTVPSYSGVGYLYSVSAAATDDVWAVGQSQVGNLVLHWDGASWEQTFTPSLPECSLLYNVDAITRDHVVATGVAGSCHECPCQRISLIWNGSAWSNDRGLEASLYDFSVLSPSDAWGAGSTSIDQPSTGIAAHWNGRHWKDTHPVSAGRGFRIAPIADDDVWLAGVRDSGSGEFFQHWDGQDWTVVDDAGPAGDVITGISGSGPDDVWATGYGSTGILEHWDGHVWSNFPNPDTGRNRAKLRDVIALSPTDAWAIGQYAEGSSTLRILMHWDGTAWTDFHRPK
jgi:hypothetical protein